MMQTTITDTARVAPGERRGVSPPCASLHGGLTPRRSPAIRELLTTKRASEGGRLPLLARRAMMAGLLILSLVLGCSKPPQHKEHVHAQPSVKLIQPKLRTISRTTGQPGFINAYEQTALYAKVSGYIDEWKVDIGDKIKKGQLLAQISVPELDAEYREKKAQVALDEVQIKVAREMANVAVQNWKATTAQVAEARANIGKFQADIERWQSEVKRLTRMVAERVVDKQVLSESEKQLKANMAALHSAQASVSAAQANEAARKADVDKAQVDIEAAQAKAKVARETEARLAALVSYTRIHAPYDGIVVVRNVNTGDYVQPGTGDQSGQTSLGEQRSSPRGTPLYVVARTDVVRIYLDVPEIEANGVQRGSKATVRIQSLDDEEVPATVTRTSWAVRAETRSLRAEIDLPNPDGRMLPNMYAYGQVVVQRANVWAVPMGTLVEIGNQNCCYLYEDGKAVQMHVQAGINDGKWVQVTKKREKGKWVTFTGSEQIIEGDLSEIIDGERVRVSKARAE